MVARILDRLLFVYGVYSLCMAKQSVVRSRRQTVGGDSTMTAQTTSSTSARFSYMGTYDSVEQIVESFRPVIHAIAAAGGPGCEVVLHDLSAPEPDLGSTIVAIENGHVTGREVGGPSTSL